MVNPPAPIQKITFDLSDVEPAQTLLEEMPYREALELRIIAGIEGYSHHSDFLVPAVMHAFVSTVHLAFNDHRPLILSPDHFWLLICQGFAIHIRENAEALHHQIVAHEGKQKIEIVRGDIQKGQPDIPWHEVIAEFSQCVREFLVTDIYSLLTPQFSTTTPIETTAFEVALLDSLQGYFDLVASLCGIPSITLEGSPDDWRMLQERTRKLSVFQLDWWTKLLEPILNELVQTAEGHINKPFWKDFYKLNDRSGGPYINGWIVKFFPYIETYTGQNANRKRVYKVNPYLENNPEMGFGGGDLTSGLSRVPFKWNHQHGTSDMHFLAGFVGIRQDRESKALRPEIGWAVQDGQLAKDFADLLG